MIAEAAFLACALSLPASFSHNHNLTEDDSRAFSALTEPARRYNRMQHPPILFAYNYYEYAQQLRKQGLNAFSMAIGLSGTHVRGLLDDIPFSDMSLAAVILLQKMPYASLFQVCAALSIHGILLIKQDNLPYLGEVLLISLGFRKTSMLWHDLQIYHKKEHKEFASDTFGFKAFSQKKVQAPYVYNRGVLYGSSESNERGNDAYRIQPVEQGKSGRRGRDATHRAA